MKPITEEEQNGFKIITIRNNMTREEMIRMLTAGQCTVTFTKVDKSIRVMPCTLNPNLIPLAPITESTTEEPKKERKENINVIPVFCTDIGAWRSFRVDSVISII